ncbi:hypothetical protein ACWXWB_17535, partial [Pantoea dispersa]
MIVPFNLVDQRKALTARITNTKKLNKMSYFGLTIYGELKGKFRSDVKSHTDDLITYQVIKQTS